MTKRRLQRQFGAKTSEARVRKTCGRFTADSGHGRVPDTQLSQSHKQLSGFRFTAKLATTFTKNRDRLLEAEVAKEFLAQVVARARGQGLTSDEHFTVDGTLLEAWAGANLSRIRKSRKTDLAMALNFFAKSEARVVPINGARRSCDLF